MLTIYSQFIYNLFTISCYNNIERRKRGIYNNLSKVRYYIKIDKGEKKDDVERIRKI